MAFPTASTQVVNEQTQAVCKVKFKESGFMENVTHAVAGHLEIPGRGVVEELSGNWDTHLSVDVRPGKPPRTLWRRGPVLPSTAIASRYHWNEFTLTLNDVTPDVEGLLPPTDSRLRPDQRMLEEGRRASPAVLLWIVFRCEGLRGGRRLLVAACAALSDACCAGAQRALHFITTGAF